MSGLLRSLPILATLLAATAAQGADAYPLLDGRCEEYKALNAERHALESGVELFVFQDAHYVWLCYAMPPESFGTLDLEVAAPGLAEPLNLHVSAQLGEWRALHPDEAPQVPESDQWWRVTGWSANALRMNGFENGPDGRRARFLRSEGRELQLAKSRFGAGEWRLRFRINGVRGPDGKFVNVIFPAADREPMTLKVRS